MVHCNQLRRERVVGCMAGQGEVEKGIPSKDLSGDETDGASVKTRRRWSLGDDAWVVYQILWTLAR